MSIRLKLLLVALTTLVLPWAGCRYAGELETALRGTQEQSLLASTGTIANALAAQPQRVFKDAAIADDHTPFTPAAGDLYVHLLSNQPLLDGYRDDWNLADPSRLSQLTPLATSTGYRARAQAGSTERYLYLYVEVDDAHFDAQPVDVHPDRDHFDRIEVTLQTRDHAFVVYVFATSAPGLIAAQRLVAGEDGVERLAPETRMIGYWLQTAHGMQLETRIPLEMLGSRLWIEAIDGSTKSRAGSHPQDPILASAPTGGRLFFPTDGLDSLLATFVRRGTRVTVIDANALKLGNAGEIYAAPDAQPRPPAVSPVPPWYRLLTAVDTSSLPQLSETADRLVGDDIVSALAGLPRAQWVSGPTNELLLTAAAPIFVDDRIAGAIVLQQAADQLLSLREQALRRLFDLTFLATASTAVIMLAFATWLSARLGRLRTAADNAVGNDGKIRRSMPESASADEIGSLARGFERLLGRLDEHANYLRTLGGKLSHELRTPLTIVRSSLDNLESEELRADQRRFIAHAREGTQRLQSILTALGAAARVEESITQAERKHFDLRELVASAVAAYRDALPNSHIVLEVPPDACPFYGAPDLTLQLLDKLVENAVDFRANGGAITVRLERLPGDYRLSVDNDGVPIPEGLLGRLFESLFEHRLGRDDKRHFGLGLYIVRLIAEFHGGSARAANRVDGGGAVFTVAFPRV